MRSKAVLLAGALAFGIAGAAQAQVLQPKQKGLVMANIRATNVSPSGEDTIVTAAGASSGLSAKVGDGWAPTVGFSYFVTDHVAVELIAGTTRHTVRAVGPGADVAVHRTWVLPPVVTLQYHFAPQARISPYVGAGLNYMIFYSGKDRNGFAVDLKDGVGYALQAGTDVAIQGPWSLNLDVKKVFFDTTADINAGALSSKVNLDPWVVSAGLGYKF